jgi:hypothetical protein
MYNKLIREITPEHQKFFESKHNDQVLCPFCGKNATLKAAGVKHAGLSGCGNVLFLHCLNGELYAQAYQVAKDYSRWGLNGEVHYGHLGSFHFRIGRAIEFYNYSGWWYANRDEGKIKKLPLYIGSF